MKLSDQLKSTLDMMNKARIETLEKQHNSDIHKIQRERQELANWLNNIKDSIVDQIKNNKVPMMKVKNYDKQKWIKNAFAGKAEHQDIWNDFKQYFYSEGLHPIFTDEHDGMGMESWISLTVEILPVRPRINSNYGLKGDLGVGEYRG
jgi:hypothetical protein